MYFKRIVKFALHRRKGTTRFPIRMRVTIKGQPPIDISTERAIEEKSWDAKTMRARNNYEGGRAINQTLDECQALISEVFARFEYVEKRIPTPHEVKALFNELAGRASLQTQTASTISEVVDLYLRAACAANQWSNETLRVRRASLDSFKTYLGTRNIKHLTANDLNGYLERITRKGLLNRTIHTYIAHVRTFLRWSVNNGYCNDQALAKFAPKIQGITASAKVVTYLTKEEITQLRNYTFAPNQNHIEQARDLLLFCCFTGLRHSDAANLKHSDIKGDTLLVVMQKTKAAVSIDINEYARAILDKYNAPNGTDELVFPAHSLTLYNRTLKDLGRLVGLNEVTTIVHYQGAKRVEQALPKWQLLCSHIGRRTFVVTALLLGIRAEVIMRWTGHSDYKAMLPYIRIVDELKAREMERFNGWL